MMNTHAHKSSFSVAAPKVFLPPGHRPLRRSRSFVITTRSLPVAHWPDLLANKTHNVLFGGLLLNTELLSNNNIKSSERDYT